MVPLKSTIGGRFPRMLLFPGLPCVICHPCDPPPTGDSFSTSDDDSEDPVVSQVHDR
ncbi:hypothetical protein BHM03_00061307 [Ensete ventricosum]|nr:hypothetical protein BHM03_00061307 [Ensete ventricosum]